MCFVCGSENSHNIGIEWYVRDEGGLWGEVVLTERQQGPPGYAHGGASASLLDEAMGLSVWAAGLRVAAVNLNVDYRRPVPLGERITITGRVVEQSGRAVHAEGQIRLADGQIAVAGRGVYVEAPQLFPDVHGFAGETA